MKKILLLSFLLVRCGIPDASSFETLLAPVILDDKGLGTTPYPQCKLTSTGVEVKIKVMVYNTESSFSGYNIYYLDAFASLSELEQNLRTAVEGHISNSDSSTRAFNTYNENTFIVKNRTTLPTVPAGSANIAGYNQKPTEVILTIEKTPQETYLSPGQYGLTVTAVSLPNIVESQMGNFIAINASNATDIPSYCGY